MKPMQIIRHFFGLIYPELCEACGESLNSDEKTFCLSCLYHLPRTNYWNEDKNPLEQMFWGRVKLEHVCALFFFGKGSRYRNLLHKLKYKGQTEIGVKLGQQLGQELKISSLYDSINVIVPVPLHPKKLYKRGYNQSEQIAKGIAQATGWELNTTALIRNVFTETQTRKTKMERWENVAEVFSVKMPEELKNKHILLVDDVLTTGATIEACVARLLEVEGCKISVATLAVAK